MRTELPAERLVRRLGGARTATAVGATPVDDLAEPGAAGGSADGAAESDTALSRWLPASESPAPHWLQTLRADPGRAGAIALGAVGVIAVLITVFTLLRDKPPPITSAKLPPVAMVSSTATATDAAPPGGPVVVSVVGLVHQPGLVTLTPGARIADALSAAGGALDGADLLGLNMARRVTDGEQVIVGIAPQPGEPAAMGSSVAAESAPATPTDPSAKPAEKGSGAGGLIDLNTATVEQLDTLPGVGPVTAAAIVAWREANGHFGSVDQLGDVDGIGPARLEKLRALVHA